MSGAMKNIESGRNLKPCKADTNIRETFCLCDFLRVKISEYKVLSF